MEPRVTKRIRTTLSFVIDMLVRREYSAIEILTGGNRLKAEHIEASILDYGKTIILPMNGAYDELDVIKIDGSLPPAYSVRFRLFTKEEGRSDLELQATLIDDNPKGGLMRIEMDGILVA